MNATPWIIVDFDNTLMGTEALAIPSLIARFNHLYAAQLGHSITSEEFFDHFQGMAREALCEAMSTHYKIEVNYHLLFAKREESVTAYFREVGVPMAPHLIEAFTTLKEHGAKFAFASNNMIQRCLSAMRFASNGQGEALAAFFGTHYFEAGNTQKPDPDVYMRAINFCGADPIYACAVEDSPTGAKAAIAAGLKTFGFVGYAEHPDTRERELLDLGAVACFKDWAEFPALWLAHANRPAKNTAA